MYPVQLSEDQIVTLRLMLRTVISRRTLENCEEYKLKLRALKEDESSERVDVSFVQKNLNIQDTYRNLDIMLFQAQVKSSAKKEAVVITFDQQAFNSLKFCVNCRYYTDNVSDPASLNTADRIIRNQDDLKRGFDNAEAQARPDATPNIPAPAGGLMN